MFMCGRDGQANMYQISLRTPWKFDDMGDGETGTSHLLIYIKELED